MFRDVKWLLIFQERKATTYKKWVCGYTDKTINVFKEELVCGRGCLKWHKWDFLNDPNVTNIDHKKDKNPFNFTRYLHDSLEVSIF